MRRLQMGMESISGMVIWTSE